MSEEQGLSVSEIFQARFNNAEKAIESVIRKGHLAQGELEGVLNHYNTMRGAVETAEQEERCDAIAARIEAAAWAQ